MVQWRIQKLDETPSTNDDVKQAAESGADEGLAVWALQQTAGRGRLGREWKSPEGNLYVSVLLRPKTAIRTLGQYSFVAALALHEVVEFYLMGRGDTKVELKWPNDVLVNGKKISGILLESGDGWLVVGMGLNVRNVPNNPLYPVTCLETESSDVAPLEEVLNKLLEALGGWYAQMERGGFLAIRAAWLARARKGAMRVRLAKSEIHGQFADLDEQGNLRMILADGTEKSIRTGDVFF